MQGQRQVSTSELKRYQVKNENIQIVDLGWKTKEDNSLVPLPILLAEPEKAGTHTFLTTDVLDTPVTRRARLARVA